MPIMRGLDLSRTNVLRLAEIHIKRYATQLEFALSGSTYYREGENRQYLQIWKEIERKQGDWACLSEDERSELAEAIECGE